MHIYELIVNRVIDGDTIVGDLKTHIMDVHMTLTDLHFRLLDINAPEIKGETKEAGLKTKAYLESLILGQTVVISSDKKDKYGRQLASVHFKGLNINQHLIDKGYAIPYE